MKFASVRSNYERLLFNLFKSHQHESFGFKLAMLARIRELRLKGNIETFDDDVKNAYK